MGGDDIWLEKTYLENLLKSLEKSGSKVAVPIFRTTEDFVHFSVPYSFHLDRLSRLGRIRALSRNWHEVHALFGIYDYQLFDRVLRGHFGSGAPSSYGDWWWVFDLISESKVDLVQNSTYLKKHWGKERWKNMPTKVLIESPHPFMRLLQRIKKVENINSELLFEGQFKMLSKNPLLLIPFIKYQRIYLRGCIEVLITMTHQAYSRYLKI